MASGLQLSLGDYLSDLGYMLGYGSDSATWSSAQTTELLNYVNDGYMQFIRAGRPLWSFLKPIGKITTLASISGTATSGTTTTLTDSGAAFGTLTGANIQITVGGTVYTRAITSNTATAITWAATGVGGGTVAGITSTSTYTIYQTQYDLPADFGSLAGKLYYSPDSTTWVPLQVVSEQQVLEALSVQRASFGVPMYAAILPKASTSAAQQGNAIILWPPPTSQYELRFIYMAVPVPLSNTYPYPLGGAMHSDTIKASCKDVAERTVFEVEGIHHKHWLECLAESISKDGEKLPQTMGECVDVFDPRYSQSSRVWDRWNSGVFEINGVVQ